MAFRVSSLNYSIHQEINAIIDNIRKKEKKRPCRRFNALMSLLFSQLIFCLERDNNITFVLKPDSEVSYSLIFLIITYFFFYLENDLYLQAMAIGTSFWDYNITSITLFERRCFLCGNFNISIDQLRLVIPKISKYKQNCFNEHLY